MLRVDENTGATDLVIDPSNPNILIAAMYQRRRTACCFVGGGSGSGIWRSDDGGETWDRLSGNGLPNGTMGRIALAMTPADPNVVYAQIEVAADREDPYTEEERDELLRRAREDEPIAPDPQSSGVWRSSDKARAGSSAATRTGVRCTSARSGPIRTTRTWCTWSTSACTCRPTAERTST